MIEQLKKTFLEVIHIDEIYPHEKEINRYVMQFFKNLGIRVIEDAFRNVIAYLPGVGEPMMLNTHLDIPESLNGNLGYSIKGNVIRSKGKAILGADPKSGLAVLLELARHIVDHTLPTRPIEFVFTRGEEAGFYGAINLDYSKIHSRYGLVLDEDGPCTNLVIQAPAFYRANIRILGSTVHARDWREGINALDATVNVLSRLPHGEIQKGVSFNIGFIRGGTARNSTIGEMYLEAEMRSFSTRKLLHCVDRLRTIFRSLETSHEVTVEIDDLVESEALHIKQSNTFLKTLLATYKNRGLTPNLYATFGGSDANIFNTRGMQTLAIGSGYYNAHQYTEYVNLKEMEDLVFFLVSLIQTK